VVRHLPASAGGASIEVPPAFLDGVRAMAVVLDAARGSTIGQRHKVNGRIERRGPSMSGSVGAGPFFLRCLAGAITVACCAPRDADAQANITAPANEIKAASAVGEQKGSWVFVPIPVSNPTFGNGLQLGALYLHAPSADGPPATSGVGAMATDNGTRLLAAFHNQSFDQDRFRLTALLGGGLFAGKFFGIGTNSTLAAHPVDYHFNGEALAVEGLARVVPGYDWFAGLNIQQAASKITFETPDLAAVPDVSGQFRFAGVGPSVLYDSRDDNTYATHGEYVLLRWVGYAGSWGNQATFSRGDVDLRFYRSLTAELVGALHGKFQTASDAAPFFVLPSLNLPGVSADRYRDARALTVGGELRYAVLPRWGLLAFLDAGRTAATTRALGSAPTIVSYGVGVRWQASAERRLYLSLDASFGTAGNTIFIQVGENF
jgi:hypothetical protein